MPPPQLQLLDPPLQGGVPEGGCALIRQLANSVVTVLSRLSIIGLKSISDVTKIRTFEGFGGFANF